MWIKVVYVFSFDWYITYFIILNLEANQYFSSAKFISVSDIYYINELTFLKIQQTEPDGRSHADESLSSPARLYSAAAERPWWGRTVAVTLIRWAWCIAQTAVLQPPFSAAAPWASNGSMLLQSAARETVTAEPWRLRSGATPATLHITIQMTWMFRNQIKVISGSYFY